METEYKYRLDDESLIQEIIDDPMLDEYVDRDSLEKIRMHAVYFDTDDMDLRQSGIAYRIRYENDRITATIKWDNHVENGCHSREEFNLVITDERFAEHPNIEAFESSDAYDVLLKAAGHKELHKKVEMELEWYYGNSEDFQDIAESLAEKYSLEPEDISKLQRGFLPDDEPEK